MCSMPIKSHRNQSPAADFVSVSFKHCVDDEISFLAFFFCWCWWQRKWNGKMKEIRRRAARRTERKGCDSFDRLCCCCFEQNLLYFPWINWIRNIKSQPDAGWIIFAMVEFLSDWVTAGFWNCAQTSPTSCMKMAETLTRITYNQELKQMVIVSCHCVSCNLNAL